jgi:hypothetical protein
MKTFNQFCIDANLYEIWNPFAPKPTPKSDTKVLAYKNYQSGELNKTTGKFTQRAHTGPEQKRYGWKPVNVSSYSKADTPGSTTASGEKFSDNARGVAVPYKSSTSSKPSVPFGTKIQMTKAPGTGTPVATTHSFDTGNFGASGQYNKSTSFDLARQTAADVSGKPNITSKEFGKQKIYAKVSPSAK